MNSIFILTIFSTIIYLYLVVLIFGKNPRFLINRVASAGLLCFAIWSFGDIFSSNLDLPMNVVKFFMNFSAVGWISFSSLFFWFILIFTERWGLLRKKFIYILLFGGIPVFLYLQWTGRLLAGMVANEYWRTNIWADSIWPIVFLCYYLFMMSASLVLIVIYWKKTKDAKKKKFSSIIFISVSMTLPLATLSDIILPEMGFDMVPSSGSIVSLIWALGLFYAIGRYKFLIVTPATAAENIIDTMSDSFFLLDVDGKIVAANDAAVLMLGYRKNELKGLSVHDLIRVNELGDEFQNDMANGKKIKNREIVVLGRSKNTIPASLSVSPLFSEDGDLRGVVCLMRDITEQKNIERTLKENQDKLAGQADELKRSLEQAEKSRQVMLSMLEDNNLVRKKLEEKINELNFTQEKLLQSEKLASLGRLTSSMAHEVNNPLQVVSGRAQLSMMSISQIKKKTEEILDVKRNLEIITNQCMRAKTIIQRLLLFAKPGKRMIKSVDITSSIDFIVGLVQRDYSLRNIAIEKEYKKSLPLIDVDEEQMQEVFINLLNNASDAMQGGGKITIEARKEDNNVVIEFKDNGTGIEEDNMKRIFDPFFTTKHMGTGLGLSVCYGIIQSHGGELKYTSVVGQGTCAAIILPIIERKKGSY